MNIELKNRLGLPSFNDRLNDSKFIDRVYQVLISDGNNLNYGTFISKFYKNGAVKVLKSLGIYSTVGRGLNKSVWVHPRLLLIIETSIVNSEDIAKNMVKIAHGNFDKTPFHSLDLKHYNTLEMSMETKQEGVFSTYVVFDPKSDLYKIGRSKQVLKRVNSLKKEYNKDLFAVGFCEKDFEAEIHFKYREKRVFSEWFKLNDLDVRNIFIDFNFKPL